MAAVRFEKVTKTFGKTEVIRSLNLSVKEGEFFTFVGPSGCGKSTILNLIAGLQKVDRGNIYFDEVPVNMLSPKERDVAMVFQSYALYPHMSVFDNIAFPLRMARKGADFILQEVTRVAGLLGLEGKLGRRPGELSGGERQRVALGRAIVRKPRAFLMDEPLSNLDARLRVEMRAEIKKLHTRLLTTTVYVTHDQSEAMGLSDRIAVLDKGVIQQVGSPGEIYLKPANVFVAGFMGTPTMNLVPSLALGDRIDLNGAILILDPPVAAGTDLLAGIRPDDLTVGNAQGRAKAIISVVEPAGSHTWVDVVWNGKNVKGVTGIEMNLRTGAEVSLDFDPSKVVLFDSTGARRAEGVRLP